jgi:hypothetical protein
MNGGWYLKLVDDFDVKSVTFLRGVSLGAIGLLDGDYADLLT